MPDIHLSQAVFRRLQALAEPLVDTSEAIIVRLLDEHYARAKGRPALPDGKASEERSLFLAPASSENLRATIDRSVTLASVESILDAESVNRLRAAVGDRSTFRCWAMTEAKRAVFAQMKPGDLVLLAPKGSGQFRYQGTVVGKLECQALGQRLWPVQNGSPWSLIYLLDQIKRPTISKEALVRELGYDPGYVVPGVARVSDEHLEAAIRRYGSLEKVLSAAEV